MSMEIRWERIWSPGQKHRLGARWGHTCNLVERSWARLLYLFGGSGPGKSLTNEVHVYDTKHREWVKPTITGVPPCPRESHTCTTVGTKLFIFGGTDGKTSLEDLHILDTYSNQWIVPVTEGDGPGARDSHSAAKVGSRLFIFGGSRSRLSPDDEKVYFNDLYILETSTMRWTRAATLGNAPAPRDSHTMSCLSHKNTLVVLGGENSAQYCLSDIFALNLDTLRWEETKITGGFLIPRAGHVAEVLFTNYIFVFGGYGDDEQVFNSWQLLHFDDGVWRAVSASTSGKKPSPRFSMAATVVAQKERVLFLHGGCTESLGTVSDIHYMRLEFTPAKIMDMEEEESSSSSENGSLNALKLEQSADATRLILQVKEFDQEKYLATAIESSSETQLLDYDVETRVIPHQTHSLRMKSDCIEDNDHGDCVRNARQRLRAPAKKTSEKTSGGTVNNFTSHRTENPKRPTDAQVYT